MQTHDRATTIRLPERIFEQLRLLKEHGEKMNDVIVRALEEVLPARLEAIEAQAQSLADRARALRLREDEDGRIDEIYAREEAALVDDPVEGRPFDKPASRTAAAPTFDAAAVLRGR